jgi:hypothetical protein
MGRSKTRTSTAVNSSSPRSLPASPDRSRFSFQLVREIMVDGGNFWNVVGKRLDGHLITRADVLAVIEWALEEVNQNEWLITIPLNVDAREHDQLIRYLIRFRCWFQPTIATAKAS